MKPPGQDSPGLRISRLVCETEDDHPQQGANGCWVGLREIIVKTAEGILEQPEELLERIWRELVWLADDPLVRVATLQQKRPIGK